MSTTNPVYQPHPIALVFPRPTPDEFSQLKESIERSGLRESIVLLDGMILDGFSRYTACCELPATAHFREFGSQPTDGTSPAMFAADKNLPRRHMTPGQRAAAAEEMIQYYESEAVTKTEAKNVVAAQFGVSTRSVETAENLKKTDGMGFDQVKKGEKTLNAAAKSAKEKSKEKEAAKADTEALDALRKKHQKAVEKAHGESFGLAFSQGIVLKTAKEIDAFTSLPKDDQKMIKDLVIRGWEPGRAVKFMMKVFGPEDTLGNFVLQCAGLDKANAKVTINGWIVSARKAVEGAD